MYVIFKCMCSHFTLSIKNNTNFNDYTLQNRAHVGMAAAYAMPDYMYDTILYMYMLYVM